MSLTRKQRAEVAAVRLWAQQLGAAEESLRICFERLELLDATLKKETT